MPHVGMEYAIMIPILIMQVILMPLSAAWIISMWTDQRLQTELQDAANNVGSTVQQLYLSLNSEEVLPGTTSKMLNVPTTIESFLYYGNGSLRTVNTAKVLNLRFYMQGSGITANASVNLGPNVEWQSSVFRSNSTTASVQVQKSVTGLLTFSFT